MSAALNDYGNDETDEKLLRSWCDGDRTAGEVLFERHYGRIARFFRNKVAEPSDLTQRTFLVLLEQADRYRGDAGFRTFLFSIANNVLLKDIRATHGPRGKVDLGTVSVVDLGDSPSRIAADSEQKQLLLRAFQHLKLDQQTVLELHYWEHMKVAEIAVVMGRPVGTIKTQMRAARKRLEELIGKLAAPP